MLQKIIEVAENKISMLLDCKETLKNAKTGKEIKTIREKTGISALSMAKELRRTTYILHDHEKRDTEDIAYRNSLQSKIENMLSIIPKIKDLKKLAFGKIRWSKIKSVEIIENKEINFVYDIMIDKTHSFVANNMILHNSVTISKANIHASLRAETTVLAAGNPKMGRFD